MMHKRFMAVTGIALAGVLTLSGCEAYSTTISVEPSTQQEAGQNSLLPGSGNGEEQPHETDEGDLSDTEEHEARVDEEESTEEAVEDAVEEAVDLPDEISETLDGLTDEEKALVQQYLRELNVGETVESAVTETYPALFYTFTCEESGRLQLDMTSYLPHYSLMLYDSAAGEIWSATDNEADTSVGFRKDHYDLDLEEGSYFLGVSGYEWGEYNLSTGKYTLESSFVSVNANESEPNNRAEEANEFIPGADIKGLIAVDNPADFYQFTLDESGCVQLKISSYIEHYSIYLYNEVGEELWSSEGNEYNDTVGFREDQFELNLESGTFFLAMTGYEWNEYNPKTGSYTIETSFTPSGANEVEPNNSAAESNGVEGGAVVRGLIGENDRFDFYSVTLSGPKKLVLGFSSWMRYYAISVYDGNGEEIWYTNQNEYNETTGFLQEQHEIDLDAGTYYIRVSGYSWSDSGNAGTGFYEMSVVLQ